MSKKEYEDYATKHLKFIDSTFESDLERGDINKRLPLFRYKIALVYLDLFYKTLLVHFHTRLREPRHGDYE